MSIELAWHQKMAVAELSNGKILCGGVGSGKSRTSLAYFYVLCGGSLDGESKFQSKELYIITTARKRDTKDWEDELKVFPEIDLGCVHVDSWNNIKKYVDVSDAFFIFDEQRVVGAGAWTRSFLKITKKNEWILLSATPGDTFMDYIPVFVANGFYKNRSEFINRHVIYSRYSKYPRVDRFLEVKRLERLRDYILVNMDDLRKTCRRNIEEVCTYDKEAYRRVMKTRFNPYTNEPILNSSELCHVLRRIVNSSHDRINAVLDLYLIHPKMIIFYNFNYELGILLNAFHNGDYGEDFVVAQWNGHVHEPVPDTDKWVYLVQYTAGAEGWNCITTDTIVFYSQNYSYKTMVQAAGRIDRINTPYTDLYYYHLRSKAPIDVAIQRALKRKKKFNSRTFAKFSQPIMK